MKQHIRRKRGKSNKKINYISYWKLSDYDCYTMSLNTRSQIRQMAEEVQLSQPKIFFFGTECLHTVPMNINPLFLVYQQQCCINGLNKHEPDYSNGLKNI